MISLKGGLILEAERLVDDKPETKPVLSNTSFRQEISIFLRSFNVLEGGGDCNSARCTHACLDALGVVTADVPLFSSFAPHPCAPASAGDLYQLQCMRVTWMLQHQTEKLTTTFFV